MPMGKVALSLAQPTARLGKLSHKLCGANTQNKGPFTLRFSRPNEQLGSKIFGAWTISEAAMYKAPNRIPACLSPKGPQAHTKEKTMLLGLGRGRDKEDFLPSCIMQRHDRGVKRNGTFPRHTPKKIENLSSSGTMIGFS